MGDDRRLQVNPEPLDVRPIPTCRGCGKRAPWCSCGAAAYDAPEPPEPGTPSKENERG